MPNTTACGLLGIHGPLGVGFLHALCNLGAKLWSGIWTFIDGWSMADLLTWLVTFDVVHYVFFYTAATKTHTKKKTITIKRKCEAKQSSLPGTGTGFGAWNSVCTRGRKPGGGGTWWVGVPPRRGVQCSLPNSFHHPLMTSPCMMSQPCNTLLGPMRWHHGQGQTKNNHMLHHVWHTLHSRQTTCRDRMSPCSASSSVAAGHPIVSFGFSHPVSLFVWLPGHPTMSTAASEHLAQPWHAALPNGLGAAKTAASLWRHGKDHDWAKPAGTLGQCRRSGRHGPLAHHDRPCPLQRAGVSRQSPYHPCRLGWTWVKAKTCYIFLRRARQWGNGVHQ